VDLRQAQNRISAALVLAVWVVASPVFAQVSSQRSSDTRPATTTIQGDTGLWFVPTGEILPARDWSLSAYRVNLDVDQGFTDVSNWPVTFGIGIRNRLELFGALTAVNRIDRDVRPLFFSLSTDGPVRAGGVVNEYPFVNDGWTGNNIGDLWLGAKFNPASAHRHQAAAVAVRLMLKVPTGSADNGAGTGKPDLTIDGILSKEINRRIELSGFGGIIVRGDPATFDLLNGVRWGFGAGLPTRRNLRLTAELHGEAFRRSTVAVSAARIQTIDGIFLPQASIQKNPADAVISLTWIGRNIFAGAGLGWNLRLQRRGDFGATFRDASGDAVGFQARIGYHLGVRRAANHE
jgi:hypothetical protein